MKKIILLLVVFALVGCTDEKTAKKALEGAGYSDIQYTGYSWFSCAREDVFSTGFRAKGPSGIFVEGSVCSGLFKSSTIRSY